MSWSESHSQSEQYVNLADKALKDGHISEANILYNEAAQFEEQAISFIDLSKKKTLGVTVVSAVALYFKGNEFEKAESVSHKWLGSSNLPEFARLQIQNTLQTIWNEKAFKNAGLEFAKDTVLISVKGGKVVFGGAPLDLIHSKVQDIKTIFYRIIEMQLKRPFRKGPPPADIQEQFRPWLFQAEPGSYQFAVRIEKPSQLQMFDKDDLETEEITDKFFEVLAASAKETPEELSISVPDIEYRNAFVKIIRNLAPTGKSFETLEIKPVIDEGTTPITFKRETRNAMNEIIRNSKVKTAEETKLEEKQLCGILRALDLNKDWLEIITIDKPEAIKIHDTGDIIDDIVGRMVNHKVIVDVFMKSDGKYFFRDIQDDE